MLKQRNLTFYGGGGRKKPYGGYCHGRENRYGRGGPNSQWDLMEVTVMGERTGMGEVVLTANGTLWRLLSWGRERREQVWERWS